MNNKPVGWNIVLACIALCLGPLAAANAAEPGIADLIRKQRPDFKFGMHIPASMVREPSEFQRFENLVIRHANMITVKLYMKSTQPHATKWRWDILDHDIAFATRYGMAIHGHPLLGGEIYTPDWVGEENPSVEQLRQIMRTRIKTIFERYPGKFAYVDVFNEALATMRGNKGRGDGEIVWAGKNIWLKMGMRTEPYGTWPVYLEDAFRMARQFGGPRVRLLCNDNNNAMLNSIRADASLALFRALKKAGIPIDGIGMQFHAAIVNGRAREGATGTGALVDYDSFSRNMKRFAAEGAEIHITEFDIHMPEKPTQKELDLQAEVYAEVLKRCLLEPACKSFTIWGVNDTHCWQKRHKHNSRPTIFDEEGKPKKPYFAIVKMLETLQQQQRALGADRGRRLRK